ncbi:MAG: hypothetical protein AAFY71_15715 [Bacteroidota bacterium]
MKWIYSLLLACVILSCEANLDRILPATDANWEVKRVIFEESRDQSLISSLDTSDRGAIVFLDNGRGFWDSGEEYGKTEPVVGDSFRWEVMDNFVELTFDFEQDNYGEKTSYNFQILENRRSQQIWRHVSEFRVWDILRQDSLDARITWQMSLGR